MVLISSIQIADPPDVWSDLGFAVTGDACQVGTVVHQLVGGDGKGVISWALDLPPLASGEVDGLSTGAGPVAGDLPPEHPNGVLSLDHLVVLTPDLNRTVANLESLGVPCRRRRDTGRGNEQAFFRMAEVILEVVGPKDTASDGPARFFGLAFTVADLDATGTFLGDRLHAPKDAVQEGRRIATLDRSAGSTVAIAFMSPEP
jgi:hypothetical protein